MLDEILDKPVLTSLPIIPYNDLIEDRYSNLQREII